MKLTKSDKQFVANILKVKKLLKKQIYTNCENFEIRCMGCKTRLLLSLLDEWIDLYK